MITPFRSPVGAVVIGRNEGARLHRCLRSVVDRVHTVVYVDSGSIDGSIDFAKSLRIEVINLDMGTPFTAARARNEGFRRLLELSPNCEFVQFIDGDCEIVDGWLQHAIASLERRQDVAVVCGRRRERFPDASVYNKLCDMEWNIPLGEVSTCGGDALMRANPFKENGGYNSTLIAGEEPELCLRFRLAGWKILRIDQEMTLHDADIHHFRQWWARTVRAGHAYAEGKALHGRTVLRHNIRPVYSMILFGAVVPILILGSLVAAWWSPWALAGAVFGALGFGRIIFRSFRDRRKRGDKLGDALVYGILCSVAKFPQILGAARYYENRLRGQRSTLIEYKKSSLEINYEPPSFGATKKTSISETYTPRVKVRTMNVQKDIQPSEYEVADKNDRDAKKVFRTSDVFERWDNDYYHPISDWFYEAAFGTLLNQIKATPDKSILDAGCGPGIHSARIASLGYRVHAIDISEPALERGRRLASDLGIRDRISFQQADLTEIPFADEAFQTIFCWGVLIHIPAADRALRELARVLKPGGRLALFITNDQAFDYRILDLAQTLLIRKPPPRNRGPLGSGNFYGSGEDKLWVWRMSIRGVTDLLMTQGLNQVTRLPGSLTELHWRVGGPLRKLLLHTNNFWYGHRWSAFPCVTNLLIFEKEGVTS